MSLQKIGSLSVDKNGTNQPGQVIIAAEQYGTKLFRATWREDYINQGASGYEIEISYFKNTWHHVTWAKDEDAMYAVMFKLATGRINPG